MSQDKNTQEVELSGKVVSGEFAKGSKSEHEALYLKTDKGSYVLRRKGGNPFNDPELQKLKGKDITAKGIINDYLFIMREYKENK